MTIIQIDPLETGQHPIQSQSGRSACWLDDYIEVPAHLHDAVWATYGWCDLQIEGDKLVGITPTERPPEPEPEPQPPLACCPSTRNDFVCWKSPPMLFEEGEGHEHGI